MRNSSKLEDNLEEIIESPFNQDHEAQPALCEEPKFNAYLIVGSEYLPKERRHLFLVKASNYEGWLIPINSPEIVKNYEGEFSIQPVYDPIMDESKDIQKLNYFKSIKIDEYKKKYLELDAYSKSKNCTFIELQDQNDSVFGILKREYDEIGEKIKQVEKRIEFHRNAANNVVEWPNPKPIQATLLPVGIFNADLLLPECLRDWVMDETERMPCPIEFIAGTAIVALGSIIGARCAIRPKANDSWAILPNLWGGIVGLPSDKKSPAISAGMKPLDRLIAQSIEDYNSSLSAFEASKTIFEAKKKAIESKITSAAKDSKKGSIDSFADDLQEHLHNTPPEPVHRRYKTNDSTIEKMGEILRANPAGILVFRDELVALMASWEKAGHEGDRSFYLEGWNGNSSFDTDRIGRGSVFIPNLCLSLFGGIQPDKLTMYLEQTAHSLANDGMLQRFQILFYPNQCQWEWRDQSPDKEAREKVYAVFERVAEFDPVQLGACVDDFCKFPYFHFDESAQKIFIEWTTELHQSKLSAEENPLISQHLAKYDKLFPALALIFHIVDCCTKGFKGPVREESALQARDWCNLLEGHARRCYSLLADEGLRSAQALSTKLLQKKNNKLSEGFTSRDVRRNQWRYLTTDQAVQSALDWLEDEGWLRSVEVGGTGPGTGRRTQRYYINPKLKKSECLD